MHPTEIEQTLEKMVVLVDSREKPTEDAKRRWNALGLWERQKLDFGDYSAKTFCEDGTEINLEKVIVIERKYAIDELAMCFTSERPRFEREFERAKKAGCRVVLLVENASWEQIFRHQYRSKLNPSALEAGILAWSSRYNMTPIFCSEYVSGRLIHDILKYELREVLKNEKD